MNTLNNIMATTRGVRWALVISYGTQTSNRYAVRLKQRDANGNSDFFKKMKRKAQGLWS